MKYTPAKRMDQLPFSGIRAVMERAMKMEREGEKIIHLEIGRPDFDTPEVIKQVAYESLNAGHVFYTSNYGISALREEIAAHEKRINGIDYEAEEVLVTVGVGEATFAAMNAFLEEGDEILVPDPVWLNYIHVPSSIGAVPVTYSLREDNMYQIDFDELRSRLTSKTKMIVVVDPSNPTGSVFSRDTLQKLAEIAVEYDLLVLSDEIYEQLVYDGKEHISIASLPGMKKRTIKLSGFSKAYSMTGWRLGYMCAPKEIISAAVRVHQYTITCASSFVQEAAVTALKQAAPDVERMRKEYERRKNYVVGRLNLIPGLSCNNPKGAFYIFVNIKKLGISSMEAADYFLEEAKLATVPGSAFGKEGEGYIRISYATAMEELEEACDRLERAVEKIIESDRRSK